MVAADDSDCCLRLRLRLLLLPLPAPEDLLDEHWLSTPCSSRSELEIEKVVRLLPLPSCDC